MKLNSNGVFIAMLILIFMMLICHTMNFFYPKSKFEDVSTNSIKPLKTDYNEIYYTNQNDKISCDNSGKSERQAEVPCAISKPCDVENTLSDSELAFFYKVAYNQAAREIFMRTLNETQ